jgi:hypothetical protein
MFKDLPRGRTLPSRAWTSSIYYPVKLLRAWPYTSENLSYCARQVQEDNGLPGDAEHGQYRKEHAEDDSVEGRERKSFVCQPSSCIRRTYEGPSAGSPRTLRNAWGRTVSTFESCPGDSSLSSSRYLKRLLP